MPSNYSRRDLFNRFSGTATSMRPPWAVREAEFVEACTRCDACIRACPENIILRGSGGFPRLDFVRGGCTFCGDCAEACRDNAFLADRAGTAPWALTAVVGQACLEHKGISCRACESWCEPRAIRFRPALGGRTDIRIEREACTGCGACVSTCPSRAITIAASKQEGIAA